MSAVVHPVVPSMSMPPFRSDRVTNAIPPPTRKYRREERFFWEDEFAALFVVDGDRVETASWTCAPARLELPALYKGPRARGPGSCLMM